MNVFEVAAREINRGACCGGALPARFVHLVCLRVLSMIRLFASGYRRHCVRTCDDMRMLMSEHFALMSIARCSWVLAVRTSVPRHGRI